ncbi:MAG: hypothetical protein ACO1Q7_20125 [Gemmatimonas sp.]
MKRANLLQRSSRSGVCIAAIGSLSLFAHASSLHAQTQLAVLDKLGDAKVRASVQQTFQTTSDKGLPAELLVRKVREGISKQSDPIRIDAAVKQLAKRLETSQSALAAVRSVDELSAGADALQAGVPESTLRDLRKLWRTKPLTVPLGVLSELVSRDVPVTQATKRVRELMSRGANDSQLAGLSTLVVADVQAGLAPDAAMELRTKGVMSLLSASTSATAAPGAITSSPPGTTTISGGSGKPPIRPK